MMRTYSRNGVQIEQCDGCRGIFLDYGELEALTRLEAQWAQPAPPAPPPAGQPYAQPYAQPAWGHGGHGGHGAFGHNRGHGRHGQGGFFNMLFST